MADIKCGRCDRHYSKFRSRCPYCGALRNKKGKRAVDDENTTWKVITGSVVLVVLIGLVAAIMIMTFAGEKAPDVGVADKNQQGQQQTGTSGGVDQVQGTDPTGGDPTGAGTNEPGSSNGGQTDPNGATQPEDPNKPSGTTQPTEPTTPTTPTAGTLSAIRITTRGGETRTDVTMKVGEAARLSYRTDPEDFAGTVTWKSSDESIATVNDGTITAVSKGNCTITVTMGDKKAECIVRVIAAS